MIIFAFANQKGGVGKTTTAVTLADGLARLNHRTLLVDLDPQGHLALSFGLEKSPGLYRWVCLGESIDTVKVEIRPNLHLVPGDKQTEKVKRQITLADFRETILADLLARNRLRRCAARPGAVAGCAAPQRADRLRLGGDPHPPGCAGRGRRQGDPHHHG